jgi:hypothetical protein
MARFTQVLLIGLLADRVALVFAVLTGSVGFSLAESSRRSRSCSRFCTQARCSSVRPGLLSQGNPTPFSYSIKRFGWSASFYRGLPIRAILAGRQPTSNPDAPPSLMARATVFRTRYRRWRYRETSGQRAMRTIFGNAPHERTHQNS